MRRRILWPNVMTVFSAAILIGAEVFGIAYGGGWAFGILLGLDQTGTLVLVGLFSLFGLYLMALFVRKASEAEPLTTLER